MLVICYLEDMNPYYMTMQILNDCFFFSRIWPNSLSPQNIRSIRNLGYVIFYYYHFTVYCLKVTQQIWADIEPKFSWVKKFKSVRL